MTTQVSNPVLSAVHLYFTSKIIVKTNGRSIRKNDVIKLNDYVFYMN